MCTKFHWSLIKNNKVIEVWNFFYKSAFWLVGLDGKIMDLHQQNFSGQYWGVKLTCIPNFSEIGQFLQKLSHFIEFRLVGWLGWLGPSDFKKISRWKADGHNISAYKKSSWYLKALKSYPILKFSGHDDHDDDTTGGWIIVRSVLTPSRTKKLDAQRQYMVIGTLALLLIFLFLWFFVLVGQRPRRGPEGMVFWLVSFEIILRPG